MTMSLFMNKAMARRFDPVFPEAGGLEYMAEVRKNFITKLGTAAKERCGDTSFHPKEAEHVRKALVLLGDDEEAKATLMSWLAFGQMKNDVAGL
jgi:hypothetical protein